MGSHALLAKSVFHYVSHVPPTYLRLDLSLPSLSTPYTGLPLPHWTVFPLAGLQRGIGTHQCCWAPLGDRFLLAFFFFVVVFFNKDLLWIHLCLPITEEAAMSAWAHGSTCRHGPPECWAVPLLGDGASQRAEDMLEQTAGDHCTDVCYYSIHCSNHGSTTEDWSCLHCHSHRVCHRGRRRSQRRWVCPVARWVTIKLSGEWSREVSCMLDWLWRSCSLWDI